MRSGFICIAGMPNAGKSTIINALVGEKVAIVSWRPQTTRNKILGVVNTDDAQIVFIDTPGIHQAKNKLGKYMMQSVASGMKDVDGVIYVLDAAKGVREEDETFLTERAESVPVIVALNKQDAVTRDTLFAVLDKLNAFRAVKAVVPVSAKKGENLEPLLAEEMTFEVIEAPENAPADNNYPWVQVNYERLQALDSIQFYVGDVLVTDLVWVDSEGEPIDGAPQLNAGKAFLQLSIPDGEIADGQTVKIVATLGEQTQTIEATYDSTLL